jgi:hypothetical protein
MRMHALILAGALAIPLGGVALADDHLANAQSHGLSAGGTADSHNRAFTTNKAGHSGDLAPGQGSPFAGQDRQTPSTDTAAANAHANVKQR